MKEYIKDYDKIAKDSNSGNNNIIIKIDGKGLIKNERNGFYE